ncbi:hypothetical protein ACA910_015759 [Epithemia clementina (nom. ined.)]
MVVSTSLSTSSNLSSQKCNPCNLAPQTQDRCNAHRSTTNSADAITKKSVWFNEECNRYHVDEREFVDTNIGHNQTWYSEEDYEKMRDNIRRLVEEALVGTQGNDEPANILHILILHALLEGAKQVNYVLDDASQLKNVSNKLTHLYSRKTGGSFEYIGLERYLSRAVSTDSRERRRSIQEVVSDIQSEFQLGLWSEQDLGKEYHDCCRHISQPQILFAQLVARAQLKAG